MAVIYVVTESGKNTAQHLLWLKINDCVYGNKLNIIPTNGVLNIRNTLQSLTISNGDIVLVNIDTPQDNIRVLNEVSNIISYIAAHPYCALIGETCFEDSLLQFKYFKEWLYSLEYRRTQYKGSKADILYTAYLNNRTNWRMSGDLVNFMTSVSVNPNNCSIEKVAFAVLNGLTNKREKFLVQKGAIGQCWYCNCKDKSKCNHYYYDNSKKIYRLKVNQRLECGLATNKKTDIEKVNQLYKYVPLYVSINRAKAQLLKTGYSIASIL